MRLVVVLLLAGCQTSEVRAWSARKTDLERYVAELEQLEQRPRSERAVALRTAVDLPGFIRARGAPVRVFTEGSATRLAVTGTVQACRDAVVALADVRWLTDHWRLRLERDRCDWEARTGEDFAALDQALNAPPPKWAPPPSELLSAGVEALKESVGTLEAEVQRRETALGPGALLEGRLLHVAPLLDSMRARPAPCDLAVLNRELALAAEDQGKLLEVERSRLVHPLEPRSDLRLRGLVQVQDGALSWRCDAL